MSVFDSYVDRELTLKARDLITKFPVLTITGPRQSGKTTLLEYAFPHLPYYTMEDPDQRALVNSDPRGFLDALPEGAILDEAQRTPELFSYLQGVVDKDQRKQFILSGSHNFLLMERISQSLAGRAAVLKLLPMSFSELNAHGFVIDSPEQLLFKGGYPRLWDRNIPPADFYPSYIQTYVERDVQQIKNISDHQAFIRFIRLCAGRVGQLLNLSSLASDAGIAVNTAKAWLSVLEQSYLVFLLQPHHTNFNKRLVKMPKLYFLDTGLAVSLLGIDSPRQLETHYAKGALFENFVIVEWLKHQFHNGKRNSCYFWRDHKGAEIDLLLDKGTELIPIEIKAGKTRSTDYFKGLKYWSKLSGRELKDSFVVYAGDQTFRLDTGNLNAWNDLPALMKKID